MLIHSDMSVTYIVSTDNRAYTLIFSALLDLVCRLMSYDSSCVKASLRHNFFGLKPHTIEKISLDIYWTSLGKKRGKQPLPLGKTIEQRLNARIVIFHRRILWLRERASMGNILMNVHLCALALAMIPT